MNVFDEELATGRIRDEHDLKVLFWTLAKKLHPDIASSSAGEQAVIRLKRDFDEAFRKLAHAAENRSAKAGGPGDFQKCTSLFSELIASNFPMARKEDNKRYVQRIHDLDRELGRFGLGGLFLDCERELLAIRGNDIVMNQPFNLVRLYFYNLSDFFSTGNYFSKTYVKKTRDSVIACLEARRATGTIRLIDWFLARLAS